MDRRILLLLLYLSVAASNPCQNRVLNALPHPDSCDKYIICWHFFPYVFQCPYDLLFDVETNNCQVPEVARCASTTVTYPTHLTSSTISVSTEFPTTEIASSLTSEETPARPTLPPKYITLGPVSPTRSTATIETSTPATAESDIPRLLPSTAMETLLPQFVTTETSFATTIFGRNQTKAEATIPPSSTTVTAIITTEESELMSTEKSKHLVSILPTSATNTTLPSVTTNEPSTNISSSTEESSSTKLFSDIELYTTLAPVSGTEPITLMTSELPWTSELGVITEVSTVSLNLASETESTSEHSISETDMLSTTETAAETTTSIQPASTTSPSLPVTIEPCSTKDCINEVTTKRALIPLPPISVNTKKPPRITLPPIMTSPRTTARALSTSTDNELIVSTVSVLPSTEQSFIHSSQSVTSTVATEVGATTLTPAFVSTIFTNVQTETTQSAEMTSTSNTTTKEPSLAEFTSSYVTSESSSITELYTEESSSPLVSSTNEETMMSTENIPITPNTTTTSSAEASINLWTTQSSQNGTTDVLTTSSTVAPESNYSITTMTAVESNTLPTLPAMSENRIPSSAVTEESTTTEAEEITSTPSPSEPTTNLTEFMSSTMAELPTLSTLQSTRRPDLSPFTLSTMTSAPTRALPTTTAAPFTFSTIPPCLQTTILIPDPLDCKYFFYCNSGFWYHYSCRYGREFSPTKLKCMRPWEAQCRARYIEEFENV